MTRRYKRSGDTASSSSSWQVAEQRQVPSFLGFVFSFFLCLPPFCDIDIILLSFKMFSQIFAEPSQLPLLRPMPTASHVKNTLLSFFGVPPKLSNQGAVCWLLPHILSTRVSALLERPINVPSLGGLILGSNTEYLLGSIASPVLSTGSTSTQPTYLKIPRKKKQDLAHTCNLST